MNRETYPNSNNPLMGDIQTNVGSPNVTVIGLQTWPLTVTSPIGGDQITFDFDSQTFKNVSRANIQVNNITVSDDYDIGVNTVGIEVNATPFY